MAQSEAVPAEDGVKQDGRARFSTFGGQMLLTTGTNLSLGLLGLITGTLVARLLGSEGRGELAAIQLWPGLLATIALLGLGEALVYYCAQESDQAGRLLSSATLSVILASLPLMAAGYLALPVLLARQSWRVVAAARCYLLLVPVYALVNMPLQPLRGRKDLVAWNALRALPPAGWLLVLVAADLLRWKAPQAVAAAYLAMLAILCLPIILIVRRRVPAPFKPNLRAMPRMLRYGLPSMASTIPQFMNLRLDQMLMAGLLPAQSLGLYVVAVGWSNITSPVLTSLGQVLFPRVASLHDFEHRTTALTQGVRLGVLCSAGIAVGLAALTPRVLPLLFGAQFAPAVPSAIVLIFAGAVAGLNKILEEGLRGLGYPKAALWSELAGLVATAAALGMLLRPMEIMGAAIASLLGYGCVALCLLLQTRHLARCSPRTLLYPSWNDMHLIWQRARSWAQR